MIDFNQLNPPQRTAVEYTEGPLLILAGAGSGKTRVLTYRIAHLMEKGVAPWHILAITFTNKAAREMAERVRALTGPAGEDAWVSTFHSFCAHMLRRDADKLGYKPGFSIYDEGDRMVLIKDILSAQKLDPKQYLPRNVRYVISDAKNRLLTPEEWLQESDHSAYSQHLYEVYRAYEAGLKANNAMDFDDLLMRALELLANNPPVLDYYRQRFWYILVDEYQDTNHAQYELVCLLAGDRQNLCVVGDDDQSIYGWRGADIRNILDFEKDFPQTKVIKLEQNYRSTGNILDAANQVIANNADRKDKALWTASDAGLPVRVYTALDERDEAYFVAKTAAKRIREGISPGEIGVLYRTNAQSRVIEEAFVRAGIPYRVYGGLKFYERKEIKDLLAYMQALANPMDDVATRRIINEPKRGIGDSTVEKLAEYARGGDDSLLNAVLEAEEAGLSGRALRAVEGFRELMISLTEALYSLSPSEFLQQIIDRTDYLAQFKTEPSPENRSRLENIQELQGAVSEYERRAEEPTVAGFLEQAALMTDMDDMDQGEGVINMMTLHSAKGLEFDLVFIPGMEENLFPLTRAASDEKALEEERRLAYVGITRARKELILSNARSRLLFNQRTNNPVSRFVEEIPPRLKEQAGARSEGARLPLSYYTRRTSAPSPRPALGIPGVQKGTQLPRYVGSAARSVAAVNLFSPGDRVVHRTFGAGTVTRVEGDGADQKVSIDFGPRGERTFGAAIAPLIKVKG